jgi:multiple sugar transport system substrate-binding protein
LTLDSPENVKALDFAASIVRDKLAPSPENFDAWVGFLQGNVAMCWEGIYMLPDLQRQGERFDWGAAPMPQLGPTQATWGESHTLCLRSDLSGPELDAAKRFIKYLSDHSLDWAEGGQVPVRRSLRDTDRFRQMTAQREFAKQIPYVKYLPPVPYLLELLPEYDYSIELALRGKATAKQALAECAERLKPVYARYHAAEAYEQREGK